MQDLSCKPEPREQLKEKNQSLKKMLLIEVLISQPNYSRLKLVIVIRHPKEHTRRVLTNAH